MKSRRPINRRFVMFEMLLLALVLLLAGASSRLRADTGNCNGQTITLPFTDVTGNAFFCQIAAAFFSGLSNGTTATTYSPGNTVTREQMAAFITRTLDAGLQRGSRRAALGQFWTTTQHYDLGLGVTTLGGILQAVQSDGTDIWVVDSTGNVHRVRASDGALLGTWTGATSASSILCALGRIFIPASTTPGKLYMLDPTTAPGPVTTLTSTLIAGARGLAFDGDKLWVAGVGGFSIVTPGSTTPWAANTINSASNFNGILYDGANIWMTEAGAPGALKKFDAAGATLQTIGVGNGPNALIFDSKNIWVLNGTAHTLSVVRAASGDVLATLSGNGLNLPKAAAFDGERILVTNQTGNSVSLWKATDLSPLGNRSTGAGSNPSSACTDGQDFWVTLSGGQLARF
jgi:hypothetical protein